MPSSTLLRPLAPNEVFYLNNSVAVVAESHLNHSISILDAQRVLEYLQKYHPLMRIQIIKNGVQSFFHEKTDCKIDLQVSKSPYQKAIGSFISTLIDPKEPFEILIIQSEQGDILVTKTQHCLSDGVSIQAFHNDFLICLETLRNKKPLLEKAPYPLPPSCLECAPPSCLKASRAQLIKETTPDPKNYSIKNLEPLKKIEEAPQIHLITEKLGRSQMNELIHLCKKHNVKFNSLICAVLILAAGSLIKTNDLEFYLLLDIPVNLRPYLDPPIANHHLSSIVSNYANYYRADGAKDIWQVAKEINADMHTHFDLEKLFKRMLVYDYLFDSNETSKIELYTSNLGLVQFDTSYYKVKEFGFYAHGFIPLIFTVTSTEEGMRLSFLYTTPYNSHQLTQSLVKALMKLLKELPSS